MSGEGFLSRWSRRKREAEAEAGRPVAEPEPPPAPAPEAAAAAGPSPAPAEPEFDLASLPPVEALTAESDFTAFLRKEVPEAIRRAALRKAWALDPAIRDFVGPADYAWDYNAPDGVPGFSHELTGDIARMLAQAMGLDETPAPPAAAAEPPPAAAAVAPARPVEDPPRAIAEAPAVVPAAPEPPPRRHGSALPC